MYSTTVPKLNWDSSLVKNGENLRKIKQKKANSEPKRTIVGGISEPNKRLCAVCNATGATTHYGGQTCGGCKIFFSRYVLSMKGFVCERGGGCVISAEKRSKCRACRFARCLAANMSPDEVGRLREMRMGDNSSGVKKSEGSVVPYFDDSSPSTSFCDSRQNLVFLADPLYPFDDSIHMIVEMFANLERSCNNNNISSYWLSDNQFDFSHNCNTSISLESALQFPLPICERLPVMFVARPNKPRPLFQINFVRHRLLKTPSDAFKIFWSRNVLHFLEWTSALKDFGTFSHSEKIHLVIRNMVKVQLLVNSYGFLETENESAENSIYKADYLNSFQRIASISKQARSWVENLLTNIIDPISKMKMSMEEMVLLKFVLLFDGGEGISSPDSAQIRKLRFRYFSLLKNHIKYNHIGEERQLQRISDFLQVVDVIKNFSSHISTLMTNVYISNICDMNDNLVFDLHVRAWQNTEIDAQIPDYGRIMKQEPAE